MFRSLFMPLLTLVVTSCNNGGGYKSIDSNDSDCPQKQRNMNMRIFRNRINM